MYRNNWSPSKFKGLGNQVTMSVEASREFRQLMKINKANEAKTLGRK